MSASVKEVDWHPVPSPCLTLVRPFLKLLIHSQTIRCNMTLFPYCTDIILCILAPGTPLAHKKGSLPSALLWYKWKWSVHVHGTKLRTEMDYQGHTCTTMVGEEQTMCILSCPTSSIANCKTCTYIADNFWLTYVFCFIILPLELRSAMSEGVTKAEGMTVFNTYCFLRILNSEYHVSHWLLLFTLWQHHMSLFTKHSPLKLKHIT